MELRCIPGASSSSITHPPPQSSSTQAAAISDRSWRARCDANYSWSWPVCRYALRSICSAHQRHRKIKVCKGKRMRHNKLHDLRWDVLMCRIHTWDWLSAAVCCSEPAGRLQRHADQVQTVMRASVLLRESSCVQR